MEKNLIILLCILRSFESNSTIIELDNYIDNLSYDNVKNGLRGSLIKENEFDTFFKDLNNNIDIVKDFIRLYSKDNDEYFIQNDNNTLTTFEEEISEK